MLGHRNTVGEYRWNGLKKDRPQANFIIHNFFIIIITNMLNTHVLVRLSYGQIKMPSNISVIKSVT